MGRSVNVLANKLTNKRRTFNVFAGAWDRRDSETSLRSSTCTKFEVFVGWQKSVYSAIDKP